MRILIVDDEESIRVTLGQLLEKDYEVTLASDGREAYEILKKESIDLILSDLKMPRLDGQQLLKVVQENFPEVHFIIMTAHGTVESAVDAIKSGAHDYILKPFSINEVRLRIGRIQELVNLRRKTQSMDEQNESSHQLIGESSFIQQTRAFIDRIADANSPVLLHGPSGTGKEVVGRQIHLRGDRNQMAYVAINCASLSENLLESELFGHEKGSFTGAHSTKLGKFEVANGGIVFLDEIGELPLALQAKLLRVLQSKEFVRVGGTRTIKSDCRIIAATNRNLEQMVAEGTFREDLFFRLNVVDWELPPLRERKSDIPLLFDHFIEKYCARAGKTINVAKEVKEKVVNHPLPGNVRQLQNVIERMVVMTPDQTDATLEMLPSEFHSPMEQVRKAALIGDEFKLSFNISSKSLSILVEEIEKNIIETILEATGHRQRETARRLGISRGSLQHKLKKYNLSSSRKEEQEAA